MVWHEPALPRRERWAILGLRGATVWLTGLPASGKSTIAEELERALVASGRPAYLLDGENMSSHGLSGDLGFSAADRHEHARRVASVARMLADAGMVTVVALVSPAAADRAWARQLHEEAGLHFVEAWVDTPLEVCEQRDPHGMYARPRRGAGGLHGGGLAVRAARAAGRAPARVRRAGVPLRRAGARGAARALTRRASLAPANVNCGWVGGAREPLPWLGEGVARETVLLGKDCLPPPRPRSAARPLPRSLTCRS